MKFGVNCPFKFPCDVTSCCVDSPCCVPLSSCTRDQRKACGWCSAHSPQWCEGCHPPAQSCPGWSPPQDLHAPQCPQRCYTLQPGGKRESGTKKKLDHSLKGNNAALASSIICISKLLNLFFIYLYFFKIDFFPPKKLCMRHSLNWSSFGYLTTKHQKLLFCLQTMMFWHLAIKRFTLHHITLDYTCRLKGTTLHGTWTFDPEISLILVANL